MWAFQCRFLKQSKRQLKLAAVKDYRSESANPASSLQRFEATLRKLVMNERASLVVVLSVLISSRGIMPSYRTPAMGLLT